MKIKVATRHSLETEIKTAAELNRSKIRRKREWAGIAFYRVRENKGMREREKRECGCRVRKRGGSLREKENKRAQACVMWRHD